MKTTRTAVFLLLGLVLATALLPATLAKTTTTNNNDYQPARKYALPSWATPREPKNNECYIWKADGITHFKDLIGFEWTNYRGTIKCMPYDNGGRGYR